MTNLPDAHTHPAPAAPGTAPRFICGTSPADWEQVALLAERDKNVTPFFGIHPWRLNPAAWKEEMRLLESFLKKFPRAGIGETGLDKCRRGIPGLPLQREALKQHLELAARLNRPAALHCCRAWGTLAGMLKEYPRLKAVLHGWTGALNPGAQLPSGNWLLSVGPREMDRPGLLSSPSAGAGIGRTPGGLAGALPERRASPLHERGRTGRPGCGQYGEDLRPLAAGRRNALPERGWQETAAFFLGRLLPPAIMRAWAFFRIKPVLCRKSSGLPPSSWIPRAGMKSVRTSGPWP